MYTDIGLGIPSCNANIGLAWSGYEHFVIVSMLRKLTLIDMKQRNEYYTVAYIIFQLPCDLMDTSGWFGSDMYTVLPIYYQYSGK